MSRVARISRGLSYAYLVFVVAVQALVTVSLLYAVNEFPVWPIIVATLGMTAGVVLFFTLPKGKGWAWLAVALAAVAFVLIALALGEAFPRRVDSQGQFAGIFGWRLIWAHFSPVLMPLLMLPYWFGYRNQLRAARLAASEAAPDSYLDIPLEEETPHRPKRSLRHRNK